MACVLLSMSGGVSSTRGFRPGLMYSAVHKISVAGESRRDAGPLGQCKQCVRLRRGYLSTLTKDRWTLSRSHCKGGFRDENFATAVAVERHNYREIFHCHKRSKMPNGSSIFLHAGCFSTESAGKKSDSPRTPKDEWESLLDNDKKQNIASIPTKRENVFTIPNLLSLSRIVAAPYIAHLVLSEQFAAASSILILAGVTDILDGQIARRWPSQKSAFGTALDPLGDKVLVTVLTLTLAKANILPPSLAVLIIGRDISLIISVFYLRYRTCPPPVTVKRYFDPTLVNVKLSPTTVSKVNTGLQIIVIWLSMTAPIFNMSTHPGLYCLYGLTGTTTVWSGLSYIFDKSTVQMLREK